MEILYKQQVVISVGLDMGAKGGMAGRILGHADFYAIFSFTCNQGCIFDQLKTHVRSSATPRAYYSCLDSMLQLLERTVLPDPAIK